MAKEKDKELLTSKKKKKIWVELLAPKYLGGEPIGETRVFQPSDVLKKTVELSLATLTGDIKKQNTKIKFMGQSVEGNNVSTEVIAIKLMPAAIKRLVRREKDRVDDSFVCLTADNKRMRIKPLVITANMTVHNIRTKIRKAIRTVLRKRIRTLTYEQVISDAIGYRLHQLVRENVRKVYPVKVFEIKVLEVEKRKANKTEKQEIERSLAEKDAPKEEDEEGEDQEGAQETETEQPDEEDKEVPDDEKEQ